MNRSCEFCKWRGKKGLFIGPVHWCGANDRETALGGYCTNFREKKK